MGKRKALARALTPQKLRYRVAMNVLRERKGAGLTVEAAAEIARISPRHWRKIEDGTCNVTLRTLVALGRAIGCDPVKLVQVPPPAGPAS